MTVFEVVLILFILVLTYLAFSFKVVREYNRAVTFRYGKFYRIIGPGLFFVPFGIERIDVVRSTREQQSNFDFVNHLTLDKKPLGLNVTVCWVVTDFRKAALYSENIEDLIIEYVRSRIQNIINSSTLDTIMVNSDSVCSIVLDELVCVTKTYGILFTNVVITNKEIDVDLFDTYTAIARRTEELKAKELNLLSWAETKVKLADIYDRNPLSLELLRLETLKEMSANKSTLIVSTDMASKTADTAFHEVIRQKTSALV